MLIEDKKLIIASFITKKIPAIMIAHELKIIFLVIKIELALYEGNSYLYYFKYNRYIYELQ